MQGFLDPCWSADWQFVTYDLEEPQELQFQEETARDFDWLPGAPHANQEACFCKQGHRAYSNIQISKSGGVCLNGTSTLLILFLFLSFLSVL